MTLDDDFAEPEEVEWEETKKARSEEEQKVQDYIEELQPSGNDAASKPAAKVRAVYNSNSRKPRPERRTTDAVQLPGQGQQGPAAAGQPGRQYNGVARGD